jgi:glycosyltransferase involved in cell wall biosynthesis
MKILVLTSTYPRFEGDPTAPFMEPLVRNTAALGHEVHLVVPENRDWARPATEGGVYYHPFRYSPRRTWTPWGYAQSLREGVRLNRSLVALAPMVFVAAVRACRAVLRRTAIDVVHAHWVIPNGPMAAAAVGRNGPPLVITVHGSDVTMASRSRWLQPPARYSLRRASAVTAVSQYMLDAVGALGAAPGTLEVIPLGVDLSGFHPDAEAGRQIREQLRIGSEQAMVLGIGRLVAWKGFDYLIEAASLVAAQSADVRFVIAGAGDTRSALERQVDRLGLRDHVEFVGAVDRSKVAAYYAAADIVAVPSIRHEAGFVEGLGYVALEALASGTPIVASDVGGLPEVVRDGETGILVEDRNPDELARAILTLSQDHDLRNRLGRGARARALEAPGWNDVATRWADLYERIARPRNALHGGLDQSLRNDRVGRRSTG